MDTTSDDPMTFYAISSAAVSYARYQDAKNDSSKLQGMSVLTKAFADTDADRTIVDPEEKVASEKRRKRLATSVMTSNWLEPTLGTPGLLGK